MGERQVRESVTVGGSREDQVVQRAVAGDGARDAEREGSVRRSLIRATLKHPDGTPPPPREPPVFTMHQQTGGNGWDAPPANNRKQSRGRGGQPDDRRRGNGASGNGRPSGNQAQPDGRSGSRSRSRRGRSR